LVNTSSQSFEPFGDNLSNAGASSSSYGFAGEWLDKHGFIYLRARYYSPKLGRFVIEDIWDGLPIQPATLNQYSYAANNPIRFSDPSGKVFCRCGTDPETGYCHPCQEIMPSWLSEWLSNLPQPLANLFVQPSFSPAGGTLKLVVYSTLICTAYLGATYLQDNPEIIDIGVFDFSRNDGGAREAARHLAMLVGANVAGFSPHPGDQDPEGRDRKHNAEGLRNTLRSIKRNLRRNESIQQYLDRQGWDSRQIHDFIRRLQDYIEYTLPNDVEFFNVSDELLAEIIELATSMGAIP
jgi:RHS repeat-associated protein